MCVSCIQFEKICKKKIFVTVSMTSKVFDTGAGPSYQDD